jgi:hypothetical protein
VEEEREKKENFIGSEREGGLGEAGREPGGFARVTCGGASVVLADLRRRRENVVELWTNNIKIL